MFAPGGVDPAPRDKGRTSDRMGARNVREQHPAKKGRSDDLQIVERGYDRHGRAKRRGHKQMAYSARKSASGDQGHRLEAMHLPEEGHEQCANGYSGNGEPEDNRRYVLAPLEMPKSRRNSSLSDCAKQRDHQSERWKA